MKHVFIVNPVSGKGKSKTTVPIIEKVCQDNNIDYEIVMSEYAGHSREIANRFYFYDDVCLYAVGGDGTAFEVLNGLNDKVQMAVIPSGSGNDFYSAISSETNMEKIIRETILGDVTYVDYGLANNVRFLNTVSVGFCAEINYAAAVKYKKKKFIPTQMVYAITAVAMLFKPKPFHITYYVDDKELEGTAILVSLVNGIRYGGGFQPDPSSKINDGLFNICFIEFVNAKEILRLLPLYFKGQHTNEPKARMSKGAEIKFVTEEEMRYQVDGEVVMAKVMNISLQRGRLAVRVPKAEKRRLEDAVNQITES